MKSARRFLAASFENGTNHCWSSVSNDQGHGESIVAFGANRLYLGRDHSGFRREHLVQLTHTLHPRVLIGRVYDLPVANHIVDDDERSYVRELERPLEVQGTVLFVRVDED